MATLGNKVTGSRGGANSTKSGKSGHSAPGNAIKKHNAKNSHAGTAPKKGKK